MVGVVDATVAVEDDLGVGCQDRVRSERANLADEVLAEREVVRQRAVGLVEERDPGIANDGGCRLFRGVQPMNAVELIGKLGDSFAAASVGSGPELATKLWAEIEEADPNAIPLMMCEYAEAQKRE